jgi:hypothetical protein
VLLSVEGSNFVSQEVTWEGSPFKPKWIGLFMQSNLNGEASPFRLKWRALLD